MDPNACLEELRDLANDAVQKDGLDSSDVVRMAELVEALDGWLKNGGFLPTDWSKGR